MALPDPQLSRRGFIKASAAAAIAAPAAGCVEYNDQAQFQAVPGSPKPRKSRFDAKSTAMQVTEGLDLTGKRSESSRRRPCNRSATAGRRFPRASRPSVETRPSSKTSSDRKETSRPISRSTSSRDGFWTAKTSKSASSKEHSRPGDIGTVPGETF